MPSDLTLEPKESLLYSKLLEGTQQVDDLFKLLWPGEHMERRGRQMRVGRVVSAINVKLLPHGFRIRPGAPRYSYALGSAPTDIPGL